MPFLAECSFLYGVATRISTETSTHSLVDQRAALMPGLFGMEAAEHRTLFLEYVPSWFRWLLPLKWKIVTTLSAGQYFGLFADLSTTIRQ